MSKDEYTIHFWGTRRMVFVELEKTTMLFDKDLFLFKTREQLLKLMPEPEVDSHMTAFTYELRTGQLPRFNGEKFERVSRLMYEKVKNDEISLNAATEYSYDGVDDVNEVLEDCLTAVSSNSKCIWVTGKPIMNDNSNLAVTIQQVRPLSWLKRKLNVQPYIVQDATFESSKATNITGTSKQFLITVSGQKLGVNTHGFAWLQKFS